MNLGLLFVKRTDKQGWFRNLVTIFAITTATVVLLSAMTLANITSSSNKRSSWNLQFFTFGSNLNSGETAREDQLVVSLDNTKFGDLAIKEYGLRQMSDQAPLLADLSRVPNEREIFISRGVEKLINEDPVFKERYSGYQLTTNIPDSMLSTPNEKIIFRRISDQQLNSRDGILKAFTKSDLSQNVDDFQSMMTIMVNTFMALCGIGFCFPLLILIISATRVGMVQREKRYAALSLLGTSKNQINQIILAETLATSLIAIVLGSLISLALKFLLFKDLAIFSGDIAFFDDISVSPDIYFGIVGLILLIVILVNYIALSKVKTSPLGVVKNQKKLRRPNILGLLPLIAASLGIWKINSLGFEWLAQNNGQNMIFYALVFLTAMIGLLTAGPFITYLVAKFLNLVGKKATFVMASKRMQSFAGPIFSSVSGVVLALFVGSFFVTTVESATKSFKEYYRLYNTASELSSKNNRDNVLRYSASSTELSSVFDEAKKHPVLSKELTEVARFNYFIMKSQTNSESFGGEIYTCQTLAQFTQVSCPSEYSAENEVVVFDNFISGQKEVKLLTSELKANGEVQDPTAAVFVFRSTSDMDKMRKFLQNIAVRNFYQTGSIGRISTSKNDFNPLSSIEDFIGIIKIGTILTIIMAGLSLAVSTIGSFFERKKSFYNLRLMGIDIRALNKVILVESVLPLLLASILSITAGILTSRYLSASMNDKYIFAMPGFDYFIAIILSLVATIGIIFAILPLLKKITSFEENRTE